MSLRTFHLVFIALSVVLAAFVAAWAAGEYRAAHDLNYALASGGSLATGVALSVYGAAFQRKMRRL
jgi:ABC-type Mn2+/Zn2+ transport system permease subunit